MKKNRDRKLWNKNQTLDEMCKEITIFFVKMQELTKIKSEKF